MRLHGKKLQNATNKGLKRLQRQIEPQIAKNALSFFLALTFESKDKTKRQRHIIQQLKMRYETVTVFLILFINTIQGPPWIAAFQSDNKSSLSSLLVTGRGNFGRWYSIFCEIGVCFSF